MSVPDYLREPSLSGHLYGKLGYHEDTKEFQLTGEPLMLEFAKRLFPGARIYNRRVVGFKAGRREISDLNWLLLRYPLDISQCKDIFADKREKVIKHLEKRLSGRDLLPTVPPSEFRGKLYKFQEEAVTFLVNNQRCILGDGMGCIDGEALVSLNRGGKGFKVKLKDAYARFHGINTDGRNWDPGIATMARSLCDGQLRLNRVVDILDKGERFCVKLILESGKVLRLTSDHEVLTPGGDVEAGKLEQGDIVFTNGRKCCPECGAVEDLITYTYAKFKGFCKKCMYRKLRHKHNLKDGRCVDNDGYVRCSGQQDHPRANGKGQVYEHILIMERHLGRFIGADEVVHHRNGDRSDNSVENLEVISVGEHHRKHSRHLNFNGDKVVFVPREDKVVSVEPCGPLHVFDMVMADPYRNFVANGVIVHNCGKTWSSLAAASTAAKYPVLIVCQTHVQRQWQRMIGSLFDLPGDFDIGLFDTEFDKARKKGEALAPILRTQKPYEIPDTPFAIIHYGLLSWWGEALRERGYDIVIFDEVQELRHTGTRKYSEASLVSSDAEYVWGLSGTPVYGYGEEIWCVLNAIEFHCLGSRDSFTREWCTGYGERIVQDPKALNGQLVRDGFLLRRRAADSNVSIDLPEVVRNVQDLMHDEVLYDKLIGAARIKSNEYSMSSYVEKGRLAREIDLLARRACGISKAAYVADFIKGLLEAGERPLVYAWHHDVHDILIEKLKGFEPSVFTGRQSEKKKDVALKRFMDGDTDLALLSLRSAAGLDGLQYRATCCVFAELDWSPAIHRQCETRIARIGVDKLVEEVPSYYCVSSVGYDRIMIDVLGVKTGQFIGLMGDEPESAEEKKASEERAVKRIKLLIDKLKKEDNDWARMKKWGTKKKKNRKNQEDSG